MKALVLMFGLAVISLGSIGLMADPSGATAPTMTSQWNLDHTCTFCHDPHGGPLDHNLWDEDIEVQCLTCHGPGGISTLKAATHEVDGYTFTCMDCHDYHKHLNNWLGGENLKMVGYEDEITGLAVINTQTGPVDVVFESLGTGVGQPSLHSFADYDEDGNGVRDGVCEVCHVQAGFPSSAPPGGYLQAKASFAGRTCTDCHEHVDGFHK
jgi:predicted CXXCH cytochrome family protein